MCVAGCLLLQLLSEGKMDVSSADSGALPAAYFSTLRFGSAAARGPITHPAILSRPSAH